jgi:Ca-activated chloride channel family protein
MLDRMRLASTSRWKARTCVALLFLSAGLQGSSAAASALQAQGRSEPYVISKQVNLVVLPVTVTDRNGRFVSSLEVSDFTVRENGHPQTITLFRNEDIPVTVGLVVDHSGSMAARQSEVIDGARTFVQASNPSDREFVVNFTDRIAFGLPTNVPFTSNLDELKAALSTPYASGRTILFDAVIAGLEHLQKDDREKKVLILISDGGDNASHHDFRQVLHMAQAANVVIYAIGLLDEHSADQNPTVLTKLARETGGMSYFPDTAMDMVRVCEQIAGDIRHQYTLGYTPADGSEPGYRRIHVSVTAAHLGKLLVRTRSGYFLPSGST